MRSLAKEVALSRRRRQSVRFENGREPMEHLARLTTKLARPATPPLHSGRLP